MPSDKTASITSNTKSSDDPMRRLVISDRQRGLGIELHFHTPLTALLRLLRHRVGVGGAAGIFPNVLSIKAMTSFGSMSPTIATVALFGP